MTTTDFWVRDQAGELVIQYASGLGGVAFDAYLRLRELIKDGKAFGKYDASSADAFLTGYFLRPLLRAVGDGYVTVDGKREPVVIRSLKIPQSTVYTVGFVEF